jgi:hypothetical protein
MRKDDIASEQCKARFGANLRPNLVYLGTFGHLAYPGA